MQQTWPWCLNILNLSIFCLNVHCCILQILCCHSSKSQLKKSPGVMVCKASSAEVSRKDTAANERMMAIRGSSAWVVVAVVCQGLPRSNYFFFFVLIIIYSPRLNPLVSWMCMSVPPFEGNEAFIICSNSMRTSEGEKKGADFQTNLMTVVLMVNYNYVCRLAHALFNSQWCSGCSGQQVGLLFSMTKGTKQLRWPQSPFHLATPAGKESNWMSA